MKLSLGVIVVPEPEGGDTYTTAITLEEKYGLFSAFANYNEDNICNYLEDSIAGAIETIEMGGKVGDPFADASEKIDQDFMDFLSTQKVEKMGISGVPTKAALEGKSFRFKNVTPQDYVKGKRSSGVKKKGPRRPSFIYSGVLQASFKSWVDE